MIFLVMHGNYKLNPAVPKSPEDVPFGTSWVSTATDGIGSEFLKDTYKAHNQRIIVIFVVHRTFI